MERPNQMKPTPSTSRSLTIILSSAMFFATSTLLLMKHQRVSALVITTTTTITKSTLATSVRPFLSPCSRFCFNTSCKSRNRKNPLLRGGVLPLAFGNKNYSFATLTSRNIHKRHGKTRTYCCSSQSITHNNNNTSRSRSRSRSSNILSQHSIGKKFRFSTVCFSTTKSDDNEVMKKSNNNNNNNNDDETNNNNNNNNNSSNNDKSRRRKKGSNNKNTKDKRREFIGKAKAVDRGQWSAVYNPGGENKTTFSAKSGLPDRTKPFTVLGIESSCDDTGAAVVRSDGVILGESLASQHEIHEEWGGIVPGLAKNAHEEKIDSVINEALHNAGLESIADVDAIGVTIGPGLEICLRVGCNKARELAMEYSKPFVGVHHLEAHILMARLPFDPDSAQFIVHGDENVHESKRAIEFPFLALLVSGGHCQLLKCLGIGNYQIIGGTIDDSLGEAFDKTARLLGLPVGGGGGPAVEALAKSGDPNAIKLPIPLQKRKDCDFSYAGLKTAVRMATEKLAKEKGLESVSELDISDKADVAASFQNVAIKHIEQRLKRAMDNLEENDEGIRSLAVVGGVAANKELRSRLEKICDGRKDAWSMFVPPPRLCTDQGSMSAWAAIERLMLGSSDIPDNQDVHARFPFQFNE